MLHRIKNEFLELVITSRGAEKQELIGSNQVHYLRKPDHVWNRVSPILFPNVGRLKGGVTTIHNQLYALPLHGFLRDHEFDVLQHKENEISLVQVYSEDTLQLFPFKYKAIVTYTLKDKSLFTNIKIVNEDQIQMPFNLGGHPGFNCPLYSNERFEDYRVCFEKTESFISPFVEVDGTLNFDRGQPFEAIDEIALDYRYFENDAIIIPRIKSKRVDLINAQNQGIRFHFDDFVSLAIWTRPQAPFVCLEPWIGYGDRYDSNQQFDKKDNIVMLSPLEEFSATYIITILD